MIIKFWNRLAVSIVLITFIAIVFLACWFALSWVSDNWYPLLLIVSLALVGGSFGYVIGKIAKIRHQGFAWDTILRKIWDECE